MPSASPGKPRECENSMRSLFTKSTTDLYPKGRAVVATVWVLAEEQVVEGPRHHRPQGVQGAPPAAATVAHFRTPHRSHEDPLACEAGVDPQAEARVCATEGHTVQVDAQRVHGLASRCRRLSDHWVVCVDRWELPILHGSPQLVGCLSGGRQLL
eukprot:14479313-Alexandrium_andersonii.AAC.2